MRNAELWRETKFAANGDTYLASRDLREIGGGSRLVGDLQAKAYFAAIRKHARGRLLDLGCGKVPLYGMYRDLVTDVCCVDWPHSWHETQHLDVYANVNVDLPFRSDCFDTVILTDVLEHVRKPEGLLREIRRILRPDGKLILAAPFYYWIHEAPHDYYRYTEFKFRDFADELGLDTLEISPYGGALEVVADILSKLLYGKKFYRLNNIHLRIVGAVLKIQKISSFSRDSAKSFPMGYVVIFQNTGAKKEA